MSIEILGDGEALALRPRPVRVAAQEAAAARGRFASR